MRDYKLWSDGDIKYLLANYPKIGLEVAKKLKRTIPSIKHKVIELGILEKKKAGRKYSLPTDKIIKLINLTNHEISDITGLSLRQVQNFKTRYKIKNKLEKNQPQKISKKLHKL